MATGFVQRWKGKVAASQIWSKGWNISDAFTPAAGSTAPQYGTLILQSASAASVFTLPAPVGGVEVVLALNVVSSAILVKAAPGTNFGVFGGSTMIVMKSTTIMSIDLEGVSTVAWQLKSAWSTSTSVIPQPTFSTTT